MRNLLVDSCIVRVEREFEDEIEVGGVKLKRNIVGSEMTGGVIEPKTKEELLYLHKKLKGFIQKPDMYKQEIKDVMSEIRKVESYDDEMVAGYVNSRDKRIFGEVVSAPYKLSDRMLYIYDDGEPYHQRGVDGDMIAGSFGYIKREQYFPTHWEAKGFEMKDLGINVKEGDRVYFYYNAINEDNLLSEERVGSGVDSVWAKFYKVGYENLFAKVVDGVLEPINCHVLCEYEYEDDRSASGLYLSAVKKEKHLVAKVRYASKDSGLVSGDLVYYLPNSDFSNTIEGEKLLVIKEREILAKIEVS